MPEETPTSTPVQATPLLNHQKSSGSWWFFLLTVIVLIVLASFAFFLFVQDKIPNLNFQNGKSALFLDETDPNLREYGEYFGFNTKLTGYDDASNEIQIELKGDKVPKVIYSDVTVLTHQQKDGTAKLITLAPLEAGQNVYIVLSYDKKKKIWLTRSITLLDELPANQTTTSSGNNN